jgi:hypothetical protein
MLEDVVIKPMTEDFLLWRCLHGGPLSKSSIDIPTEDSQAAFKYKSTSSTLVKKLIQTYETCAMLAWDQNEVVGFVRFYPKIVEQMNEAGHFCLLQDFPNGPSEQLVQADFPHLDKISDKTLSVNCMMTGSPLIKNNPYQRKGLGTSLIEALIEWARVNGWQAIEAEAYHDLPLFFEVTGNAGRSWWQKLGFNVVSIGEETAMKDESEFFQKAKKQAKELGLNPDEVAKRFRMRLEL